MRLCHLPPPIWNNHEQEAAITTVDFDNIARSVVRVAIHFSRFVLVASGYPLGRLRKGFHDQNKNRGTQRQDRRRMGRSKRLAPDFVSHNGSMLACRSRRLILHVEGIAVKCRGKEGEL